MDFFSKLGSKITDTGGKAVQKTKDAVEVGKLKSQIATEESRIQAAYLEIGKKFFESNPESEEYAEFINIIKDAKAKIDSFNNDIMAIKGSYNCPKCGTEVLISAAFCANCGAKLEPPVKSKTEEAADTTDAETTETVVEETTTVTEETTNQ